MRNKRAKELKKQVKAEALQEGVMSVSPNTIRKAKRDYVAYGFRMSQKPILKLSKRQERLQKSDIS